MPDTIHPTKNPAPKERPAGAFPHERLDAYKVALEVVAFVAARRSRLHGMPGELRSHLERSSVSALMNIAEAAARSGRDAAARFGIARAECCEAAAAAQAVHLFGGLTADEHASLRGLLGRLGQMLTRLSR